MDDDILIERRGRLGLVTLNRPAALNALTYAMVKTLRRALDDWAREDGVATVALQAAGGRAFCAGGDIRRLYDQITAGEIDEALDFWRREYDLNRLIRRYPKPYVALIDGVVMGGGVGVSLHGARRVAGPRMSFAMPEVGIGFFPDVGATWALPRLPGATGTWLALTGARVGAGDALALGLATDAVAAGCFEAIVAALADGASPDAAIAPHRIPLETGPATAARAAIDACFSADDVETILSRLEADGSDFSREARSAILRKSPTSLRIALRQMRIGAGLDFETAMRVEYRIVSRLVALPDFVEGVRATIIDKDQSPRWRPATLAETPDAAPFFAPLGDAELSFHETAP